MKWVNDLRSEGFGIGSQYKNCAGLTDDNGYWPVVRGDDWCGECHTKEKGL